MSGVILSLGILVGTPYHTGSASLMIVRSAARRRLRLSSRSVVCLSAVSHVSQRHVAVPGPRRRLFSLAAGVRGTSTSDATGADAACGAADGDCGHSHGSSAVEGSTAAADASSGAAVHGGGGGGGGGGAGGVGKDAAAQGWAPPKVGIYYRRPLPPSCLDFSSDEGKRVFAEAMRDGTMQCYFMLASQFRTQDEPAFCGLTTLVMVLNALNIDPGRAVRRAAVLCRVFVSVSVSVSVSIPCPIQCVGICMCVACVRVCNYADGGELCVVLLLSSYQWKGPWRWFHEGMVRIFSPSLPRSLPHSLPPSHTPSLTPLLLPLSLLSISPSTDRCRGCGCSWTVAPR
jgi:hypothetical protein